MHMIFEGEEQTILDGKKSETLEARFLRCKSAVQAKGKSKSSAYAICSHLNPAIKSDRRKQLKKSQIVHRTRNK